MCGIIGIYNKEGLTLEDLKHLVFMILKCQVRGTDATGFFNSEGQIIKAPGNAEDFVAQKEVTEWLVNCKGMKYVVGHTRAATRGSPQFNKNNHPLMSTENGFAVVHNGIARSPKFDKDKEVTDSYIFVHAVDHLLKKKGDKRFFQAIRKTFGRVYGMNAVVLGSAKELVLGRSSGRPLQIYAEMENSIMIKRAFFGSTSDIIGVKGCKGIKDNFVFGIDVETGLTHSGKPIHPDTSAGIKLTTPSGNGKGLPQGVPQLMLASEIIEGLDAKAEREILENTEICRHCKFMNLRIAKKRKCYCRELENWFDPDTPICSADTFVHYKKKKRRNKKNGENKQKDKKIIIRGGKSV